MTIWYSPGKNHFYTDMLTPSYFEDGFPIGPISDAVEITQERHQKLLDELRQGRVLQATETETGLVPVTVKPVLEAHVLTFEEIMEQRRLQYRNRVDPITNEAKMERLSGNEDIAVQLEAEALLEYQTIKQEYPFPS